MTIREYKMAEITEDTHNQYRFKEANTQIDATGAHYHLCNRRYTHGDTITLTNSLSKARDPSTYRQVQA